MVPYELEFSRIQSMSLPLDPSASPHVRREGDLEFWFVVAVACVVFLFAARRAKANASLVGSGSGLLSFFGFPERSH
jgi:hypothetical protein